MPVRSLQAAALRTPGTGEPQGPLAFLSACESANVAFESPTSFPKAFLEGGFRAVVASLVSVDSKAAADLAVRFYAALAASQDVGCALLAARNGMLGELGNLIGLAYACYGESRLTIDPDASAELTTTATKPSMPVSSTATVAAAYAGYRFVRLNELIAPEPLAGSAAPGPQVRARAGSGAPPSGLDLVGGRADGRR